MTLLSLALTAYFVGVVVQATGRFDYSADDAYIHLAIAKHQIVNGVWGVTPYEWSSSSSSPLWGLLLVGLGTVFGSLEGWPLILNLAAGVGLLALLDHAARQSGWRDGRLRALALISVILALPIPYLVLQGMEHLLHALLSVLLIHLTVTSSPQQSRRKSIALVICAALVSAVRFEGIALVMACCLALAWQRRWRLVAGVAVAGVLPLALYAALSLHHGWFALPNSVVVKRAQISLAQPLTLIQNNPVIQALRFGNLKTQVYAAILLSYVLLPLLLLVPYSARRNAGTRRLLVIFALAALAHALFARSGIRYESYLTALLAYVLLHYPWRRQGLGALLSGGAAVAVVVALLVRGLVALPQATAASVNSHDQQRQMGRFVHEFYTGDAVALNDIGYVNYLADIHLVDMVGLASLDVAKLRMAYNLRPSTIADLTATHDIKVALLYEQWFMVPAADGATVSILPDTWLKVGQWTIRDRVIGGDTVTFYATSEAEADRLLANLRAFEAQLPPTVRVTYLR